MKSDIRVLTENEYDDYLKIQGAAYPLDGMLTEHGRKKAKEEMLQSGQGEGLPVPYGLYRDGKMAGAMMLIDYDMTLLSARVLCGGVGGVAVHLAHKKEHIALDLVRYSMEHYRQRKAPVAALYPFRPDFYHKMGFGYCTRVNQYRIKTASLPCGPSKEHMCHLEKSDMAQLRAFYNGVAARTNGMMQYGAYECNQMLESEGLVVAYRDDDGIKGYMWITFEKCKYENLSPYDIVVRQFVAEREALPEMLTFLHAQADQANNVVFHWQDDHFFFVPSDPRAGSNRVSAHALEVSAEAVGLMIRVLDVRGVFQSLKEHDFGGVDALVKIRLRDNLIADNDGIFVVRFDRGRPTLVDDTSHTCDVEISMDIAEFSSMLVGAVDFRSLYRYRLAEASDPAKVSLVNRIFHTEERPKCTTDF